MNISRETLTAALAAFKIERQKIDQNIAEVEALLGGKTKTSATVEPVAEPVATRGRGKRSAAVRQKMALAQRARWAKLKGESVPAPEPVKAKRKLSEAGRKAIIAATKKRWAAKRAAEKKAGKVSRKRSTE
jgi:hypothetical protein